MSTPANSAGHVLLMPKGEYNSATTYQIYNVVYYATNSSKGLYVAKVTTTNVPPTNTTNWQILLDLTDYISALDIATASDLGIIKSDDGQTTEVSVTGILKAVGVGIVCTVNSSATTPYGSNWLKWNGSVITPDTRQMYRVNVDGKEYLFFWNGTQYIQLSGGGHSILNTAGTSAMDQRENLQFRGMNIIDDSTNDKTIVDGQIKVCNTELAWNNMTFTQKNDANTFWYLPWKTETSGEIDDTTTATDKVWSSQRTGTQISLTREMITKNNGYSSTKQYYAGDWLISGNVLYKVIQNCIGVTPPDSTYYEVISVDALNTDINNLLLPTAMVNGTNANDLPCDKLRCYACGSWTNSPGIDASNNGQILVIPRSPSSVACTQIYTTAAVQAYHKFAMRSRYSDGTWQTWEIFSSQKDYAALAVTSGSVNYVINRSYAFKQGNRVHAEVYGTLTTATTTGISFPFFSISGFTPSTASAGRTIGSFILDGRHCPGCATVNTTDNFIHENYTSSLSANTAMGFVLDFIL